MKVVLALLLAGAAFAAQAESWRFALIGDTPYADYDRRELPGMIEAIAAEHVDLIIHIGDFKHSKDACSDVLFEDRRQLFDASPAPFIYIPGDNEWSDCGIAPAPADPKERLLRLRELFHRNDTSLGQQRTRLERQPGDYREHQRWRLGPVLFVSLNVPGGNNNFRPDGEAGAEAAARMPQVLQWLRESFTIARRERLPGIVVAMQANPGFGNAATAPYYLGYRDLVEALRDETLDFSGQVLLVHGDTHWQRIDQPLHHPVSGARLTNFTRVETFGYPYMGWVKAFIEPDTPTLFRFETQAWPRPGY